MAPAISADNISKKYRLGAAPGQNATFRDLLANPRKALASARAASAAESFWALKDVSFSIPAGAKVGFIGKNGAGKSTLLKILSRITHPTEGQLRISGRVASLLEVGTGFHPELTGRENIFLNGAILGMPRSEIRRKFDEIVAFAEVERFLDTPVKRYSSGMYVRLAFAVAAHLEPEILIVDEVLAVGDAQFQKKCLGKMSEVGREGRTVLFVSHNMAAIKSLCSTAVLLRHGQVAFEGDTNEAVSRYLQQGAEESGNERIWDDPETAPGNELVRLRRVAVEPVESRSTEITIRQPFRISVEYWNQKPNTRLSLSMHVVTPEETVAFATTTWQEPAWNGKEFPQGRFRSTCRIPGDLMNVGPYHLRLFFVENGNHAICHLDNLLTFELLDSTHDRGDWHGPWAGVVRPQLEWNTEFLEEDVAARGM